MIRRDPAIVVLALGQTLAWASVFYIFPALLLQWEQDLGWSKPDITFAAMLALLVSAVASPFTGRLVDAGHGAWLLTGAALGGGLGLIALSFVEALWQFYAVWLCLGLAMAGCLYEPCFALVTRARGKDAKPAIIVITLVAGLASTLSFPSAYVLAQSFGWRGAVLVAAIVMIGVVAPLLWIGARRLEGGKSAPPLRRTPEAPPAKTFLKTPAFWFLGLGFACMAIGHGATIHHLLPILDERGYSAQVAVLAASCVGPMQVAGRVVMMTVERFVSNHHLSVAAFLLVAISIVALLSSSGTWALLAAFVVLFGGAYGTVSILRPLLARDILGEANFGAKSGALAVPYLGGVAVSPYLGSLLWERGGYDLMLTVLVALLLLGATLYGLARRGNLRG